jgi:F-box-like
LIEVLTITVSDSIIERNKLISLPSDDIFEYLQVKDLAKLALTSRALYAAVQTPLYHRPQIKSYYALTLFVRTLNQVSEYPFRKAQWKWWKEDRPLSKDVSELGVTIDPVQEGVRNRGQRPTAVIIGRLIKNVVA